MSEPFDPQVLDLLERRYTPGEQQRCRLCGRPMKRCEDIGPDLRSYRCTIPPPGGLGSLVGWARHRRDSELIVSRKPDPEVIALVEAYRRLSSEGASS